MLSLLLAAFTVSVHFFSIAANPLWPLPKEYSLGNKTLWVADEIAFDVNLNLVSNVLLYGLPILTA